MPSINLKKRSRDVEPEPIDSGADVDEPVGADGRTTAKKGRPTPKRSQARATRSTGTFGAPATTKEARARDRSARRNLVQEQRAAMRAGDVSKMPPGERVPERVLARDIVDSRYNVGPVFLVVIVVFYLGSFFPSAAAHKVVLYVMLLGLFAMIADSFYLSQKVARAVAEAYPDSQVKVKMYAVRRAIAPRRFRMPKARVTPRSR
ncbi:DUF3043 domain-containing protein [Frankia sp. AgB1.9]|uniref:DUF3043 domain-containing protein n=1 Tax=unclassified Frankia TaxID=2632575 RepID=UPI001933A35B|nr:MULTISPECIES: DUF3043 domain-containing protein [unclassified Frankia]MBL7494498.1 DUF3043 domain-containing protein [Frankia sp. AgW1.1]MBL7551544.1 DUF3043 domain-containing protein [Frankia sp. AgB1.9]MBL7622275.1 DUF3043 domain-containing protein [Frankia sp. AgB1.8]